MAIRSKTQTALILPLLVLLGLTMPGCETSDDLVALDPPAGTGWLAIESGVDGFETSWRLVSPDGTETYGSGDSLITEPQAGEYWIYWEPVEAWNSPVSNPESKTLTESSTETFVGSYAKIQGSLGDVLIEPAPKELRARWTLHGPDGFFLEGAGRRKMKRRAVGEYTVVWGTMDGYATPSQASSTLEEGATLELRTVYEPVAVQVGTIEINPDPDLLQAPWELTSDGGTQYTGSGDSTLAGVPLDGYVIVWGAVDGYVTPQSEVGMLEEGAPLQFMVTYEAAVAPVGTVMIDPNPDSIQAPWVLETEAGRLYSGDGDSRLDGLPVGLHTLTWGDVGFWESPSPNPVTVRVDADQIVTVVGTYEEMPPFGPGLLPGYSNYRTLTVASGKVTGTHTDEVVGFFLNPADYPEAMPGGTDLRFTNTEGTLLDHELVSWTASEAILYFKADVLTDESQFLVHYGNPDSTSTPPVRTTWSKWAAVYHFEEYPTTHNRLTDSSGNGIHGTLSAQSGFEWSMETRVPGAVGFGWDYETQRVTTLPDINLTGSWTTFVIHKNTENKNQNTGLFTYHNRGFYWDLAGRGDITIKTLEQTEPGIWLRGTNTTGASNNGSEFVYVALRHEPGVDGGVEFFSNGALQSTSWAIMDGNPWTPLGVPVNANLDLVGTARGAGSPFGLSSAAWNDNASDGNDGISDEQWIYDGLADDDYIALLYENLANNAGFWMVSSATAARDVQ